MSTPSAAPYDAARAYGSAHPEVFGGLWWQGPRLQVAFTSLQPYEQELQAELGHPGDVDVVLARWTLSRLGQVRAAVERRLEQSPALWQSIGEGVQRVTVDLRADAVALAAELLKEHGEVLELTVGGRPYPPDPDAASSQAPPGPVATAARPDLQLRASCEQPFAVSGHGFRGQLVVRNTGSTAVQLHSEQPLLAVLLSADGRRAGSYTGLVSGTGLVLDLPPGGSASIAFLGGTAGGPRYATPPGRYDLVVVLPLYDEFAADEVAADEVRSDDVRRGELLSDPVPFTVLEP
ncbi:MAG TPA: hypothetical protein VFR07_16180 [Mycobacteriales bacterium]|jgi:hypothetical protein|nr:hypothetical protein [Mycobacteriales bacterium]